jgi:hypothetical protein
MTCVASAQSNPASWENLNTLQPGEKIQILEINTTKVSGTFLNVSDAAISLQEGARQEMVQRPDVRSVTLSKGHRLDNTLLGAAIGFLGGAAIGAALYREPTCAPGALCFKLDTRGSDAALGSVIGLIVGTVVGVSRPGHKTIYRVKAQ